MGARRCCSPVFAHAHAIRGLNRWPNRCSSFPAALVGWARGSLRRGILALVRPSLTPSSPCRAWWQTGSPALMTQCWPSSAQVCGAGSSAGGAAASHCRRPGAACWLCECVEPQAQLQLCAKLARAGPRYPTCRCKTLPNLPPPQPWRHSRCRRWGRTSPHWACCTGQRRAAGGRPRSMAACLLGSTGELAKQNSARWLCMHAPAAGWCSGACGVCCSSPCDVSM